MERVLGEGGMGVVLAARDTVLDRMVALKFMNLAARGRAESAARFLREARAAVQSEHVARLLEVGEDELGAPFIAYEYLDGSDLDALLAKRGALPP